VPRQVSHLINLIYWSSLLNNNIAVGQRSGAVSSDNKSSSQRQASLSAELHVGGYVKVQYDAEYYPAEITAITDDLVQCNCMRACKSGWRWPERRDEIWYKMQDIVNKLLQPIPVTSRGVFKFTDF
jgi:hypothetical protein